MGRLLRSIRKLILRSRVRIAKKDDACLLNHFQPCIFRIFADKPDYCFPEKGWRLIAHIKCAGSTVKIDKALDIELNEELLERVDFLACLFSNRKSY